MISNEATVDLEYQSYFRLVFPVLAQDITERADKWGDGGKNGRIDPFTEIYNVSLCGCRHPLGQVLRFNYQLVFVMTARMTTCSDLTKNDSDLKKIGELFLIFQKSATPASLLLPWFPSPARKAGKEASTELYTMLYTYVEARRHAERLTSDPTDLLIAEGETTQNIVKVSLAPEAAWGFVESDPTFLVRHGGAFCWYP